MKRENDSGHQSGYHEFRVQFLGDRANRAEYHHKDAFDQILADSFKSAYAKICELEDLPLPKKKDRQVSE
jgi:hypothetical protein